MSLQKDSNGRRWVQVEVEVPGTPEEVWEAIATGPGVSSWFVPTEIDPETGDAVLHFGPGMDVVKKSSAWEPPHRFASEGAGPGPNAPPMTTEWTVEARDGGTCVVRVVHSLFASTDDWDNQLGAMESGWPAFFQILRLYLTHFRGVPCSAFRVMGFTPRPVAEAWESLAAPFGLAGAAAGSRVPAGDSAPSLGGVVESAGATKAIVRTDEPAPGVAYLFAQPAGKQVMLIASFYFYGDTAAGVAARDQPLWEAWMRNLSGVPGEATCS